MVYRSRWPGPLGPLWLWLCSFCLVPGFRPFASLGAVLVSGLQIPLTLPVEQITPELWPLKLATHIAREPATCAGADGCVRVCSRQLCWGGRKAGRACSEGSLGHSR